MIILTGFGPYGKYTTNLSSEIVKKLIIKNHEFQIIRKVLPVSWKESINTYTNLLSKQKLAPKLVVLLGIHSCEKIHLEKYGWNFKIGDDIEHKFKFGPIKIFFSFLIKTKINLDEIYSNLKDKRKISISFFPGFYLCNYLYYWALYYSKKEYPVIFIHVPEKGNVYEITKKIEMILNTIIRTNFNEVL